MTTEQVFLFLQSLQDIGGDFTITPGECRITFGGEWSDSAATMINCNIDISSQADSTLEACQLAIEEYTNEIKSR